TAGTASLLARRGTRRRTRGRGTLPGPLRGRSSSLLERSQRQSALAQLLPVELGLLAKAGPDDGPAGVVDPVRQLHPAVVREPGDDRGRSEEHTSELQSR